MQKTLNALLDAAAAPDNFDAFLRRVCAALCRPSALGTAAEIRLDGIKGVPGLPRACPAPPVRRPRFTLREKLEGDRGFILARLAAVPKDPSQAGALFQAAAKLISARLAREERDRALNFESDVSAAVAGIEDNFLSTPGITAAELARIVLDEARRLTGSAEGLAGQCAPSGAGLTAAAAAGASWKSLLKRGPGKKCPCLETVRTGKPVLAGKGKKQVLTAPALSAKTVTGLIAVSAPAAPYTDRETGALQRLARVYALVLERMAAEDALRREQGRFSTIITASQDLIYAASPQGHITFISPRVSDYGYAQEEVLGRSVFEFAHPEDRPFALKVFARAIKTGTTLPLIAYRLRRKDGTYFYAEQKSGVVYSGGRPALITGVIRDVTQKREMENALREREQRYRALFENAGAAIMLADAENGKVLDVNPAAERLMGRPKADLIGRNHYEFHPPQKEQSYRERFARKAGGASLPHKDLELLRPDGTLRTVQITTSLLEIEGRLVLQGIFHDVTEQRQAEKKLWEATALNERVVDSAEQGVIVNDRSLRIVRFNHFMERLTGLKEADLLGRKAEEVFPFLGSGGVTANARAVLRGAPARRSEFRFEIPATGKSGWVSEASLPLRGRDGTITGVVAIIRDVSEERETENKYRALVESTGTGYLILDEDGRVLDCNPEYLRLTGRGGRSEILGRQVTEWTAWYDHERNAAEVAACMKNGRVRNLVVDYESPDGRITPVEVNAGVVEAAGRRQIIAVCRDISERRRAENLLRESEERYRQLFDSNADPVLIQKADGSIMAVNAAACRTYGYTREEFLRLKGADIEVDARSTEMSRKVAGLLSSGHVRYETRHRLKNGRTISVEVASQGVAWDGERVTLSTCRDITARKAAAAALKESEAKFRRLVEDLGSGYFFYRHGPDGVMTYVSPSATAALGYPEKELLRHFSNLLTDNPVNREVERKTALGLQGLRQPPYELEIRHKDGSLRWLETSETPVFGADGKVTAVEGLAKDITARKLAEKALAENERFLSGIIDNIPDMVFVKEAAGLKFVRVNRAAEKIMGAPAAKLIGTGDGDHFPREDAEFFTGKDREVLASGKLLDIPEEIIHAADGVARYLHTKKIPLYGPDGRPAYLLGISEDITEKKKMEELLQRSEQQLQSIFDTAEDAIFLKDLDGRYLKVNRACGKLFGVAPESMPGKTVEELFPAEVAAVVRRDDEEVIKQGDTVFTSRERTSASGRVFLSVARTPLRGKDGKITGVLGIARDVTDLKKMENELATARAAEALSKVARPMAHDFNNALAAISGYATMLDDELAPADPMKAEIAHIIRAVNRAAEITSKFQDFARNPKIDGQEEDKK